MQSDPSQEEIAHKRFTRLSLLRWSYVLLLVWGLLSGVRLIGSGFQVAGSGNVLTLFVLAGNPFSGLMIGILATALLQSSSTVTSIIVGLVAGGLPVPIAIPMIMGANIGTTITNTLVALGHLRNQEEFRRAFAAATVHDQFNLLCVAIFLPLELLFHPLERLSGTLAGFIAGGQGLEWTPFDSINRVTSLPVRLLQSWLDGMEVATQGLIKSGIGALLILLVITLLGRLLRIMMIGRAKRYVHNAIGRSPWRGIGTGTLVTMLLQSSSTTTSLLVPLVGSGVFTTRQIYPFTLGANIGTCVTSLLAAFAIRDGNAILAMQIALVHVLFNCSGVLLVQCLAPLRMLPLKLSAKLATVTERSTVYAALYILGVFFLIPMLLIRFSTFVDPPDQIQSHLPVHSIGVSPPPLDGVGP